MHRAQETVADAIGDLMAFWNFKPSMGRVWSVLYLSQTALDADEIAIQTGLSAGSVSMTVQELLGWGVIRRDHSDNPSQRGKRKRKFTAETDIMEMVTRVFRERESKEVERLVVRLTGAMEVLSAHGASSNPSEMMKSRFLITRVGNLLGLARRGESLIHQFVQVGSIDLRSIRNSLSLRSSIEKGLRKVQNLSS